MKNLYFLLFLLISFFGFGQCPTSDITLSSQADVDAFTTNYPNCTNLEYRLTISGTDIVDLLPLSTLNSVRGLYIRNNLQLVNLQGLNLSEISYAITQLYIENNPMLIDISDLSSTNFEIDLFDNSSGELRIKDNPLLVSLNGLEGLPEFVYSVYIQNNDSLLNFTGLSTVGQSEDLVIDDNDNLVSFFGFSDSFYTGIFTFRNNDAMTSLTSLNSLTADCGLDITNNELLQDIDGGFIYPGEDNCGTYLIINNNPNLSICSNSFVCSALPFASLIDVNNNDVGCDSVIELAFECGLVPSNDDCESAAEVNLNEPLQAYNEFSTESPQTPSCGDMETLDIWFEFSSDLSLLVDILIDSNYYIQVWEGSCSNLTQVSNTCVLGSLIDFSVVANTTYFIQVWSDNTSRMSSGLFDFVIQDATLSVDDIIESRFSMSPNPLKNKLEFKSSKIINTLEIYNLLGQNVMNTFPNQSVGDLDVSYLSSGMYIIKVGINNTYKSYRVIKE